MKYTTEFSEQIRQLDLMVILQKEYDLFEHKKRHVRKMIALHYNNRTELRKYEQEFREVVRQMKMIERQMSPIQESIDCPRLIISRYMELYQVSIPSVARTLHVSPNTISRYLQSGSLNHETKPFIYWAIRNFRLDANRYWNLIQSLDEQQAI